jgi:hypothetical protein
MTLAARNHQETAIMALANPVEALNRTPWNLTAQLGRLQHATAGKTREEAQLIVMINLLACVMWLAKSRGVQHTCDLLDAYANRLIEDQAEVLGFEA